MSRIAPLLCPLLAHVEPILAKLGATRRAEIAAWVATVSAAGAGAGHDRQETAVAGHR